MVLYLYHVLYVNLCCPLPCILIRNCLNDIACNGAEYDGYLFDKLGQN